jgi:hypothetical protein
LRTWDGTQAAAGYNHHHQAYQYKYFCFFHRLPFLPVIKE